MSTFSLRLPVSLHNQFRELAKQEGISINRFAASALAEKRTVEYLAERGARGERGKFLEALAKVKDREPDTQDNI